MIWRIIGASVAGTSHTRVGTDCEDANAYKVIDQLALAAVADGLGSASQGREGSELAATTALNALVEELDAARPSARPEELQSAMNNAFIAARQALERYAENHSIPLRELGTTLLTAACGPGWLVTGHIGDGAIFGYLAEGEWRTVSEPERGEYANVTMPLTMDGAMEHVRCLFHPDAFHSVVLMSDGLQNLALNTQDNSPFERFLNPVLKAVSDIEDDVKAKEGLRSFLGSEAVNTRTDDDKTLVLISRVASTKSPPENPETTDHAESTTLKLTAPLPPAEVIASPQAGATLPPITLSPTPHQLKPMVAYPGKSPAILEAEQLEQEARELEQEARELEENARRLDEQGLKLYTIDPKQFDNMKRVREDAKAKRKEADKKRKEADKKLKNADKLRAGKGR